jgi:hypothetical protein
MSMVISIPTEVEVYGRRVISHSEVKGRWTKYLMLAVSRIRELQAVSWEKKEEVYNKTAPQSLEGTILVLLLEVSNRYRQLVSCF